MSSRHRVVAFFLQKDLRSLRFMSHPYSNGHLHDSVDEYDQATHTQLVKLHQTYEFGCNAFNHAYAGIASSNHLTRIAAYTYGEPFFHQYEGTFTSGFNSLGPDTECQVLYYIQAPYPLDGSGDNDDDLRVWNQYNKMMEQMVRVLAKEYEEFRRQSSSRTVFVERNVFAGYAPRDNPFPANNSSSRRPYMIDVDHGQVEVDPMSPYFDSSAGETGQWIDPGAPPFEWPSQG